MFFSFQTSVPQELEISGIPALQMFITDRREDTWAVLFREVVAAGYDHRNIAVQGVDRDAYGVMISIADSTTAYPMVVLYDVASRIYIVMFERYDEGAAVDYLQQRLSETASIQGLASISVALRTLDDRAELVISYNADDKVDRRALITLVAGVAASHPARVQLLSYSSNESRLTFTVSGPEYQQLVEQIRETLRLGYRDMIAEVTPNLEEAAPRPEGMLRRLTSRLFSAPSADEFQLAAAVIGDRVVGRDGAALRTGTVEAIARVQEQGRQADRLQVRYDNGAQRTLAVAADGSGLLGFTSVKRKRLDPVSETAAAGLLERTRWMSAPARKLTGERP